MGKKLFEIGKYFLLLILTIILALCGVVYILSYYRDSQSGKEPIITIPPVIDECPGSTNCAPNNNISSTTEISLITPNDNYNIPSDPFEQEVYKQYSKRLALIGEFDIAIINIKGSLPTDDPHFVILNLNSENGVYNAVRNSAESLDISLSKGNLGIFTKTTGINIILDLLTKTSLATTREEFLATRETTKLIKFWDYIKPTPPASNISRILVAPFNKDGIYTGKIDSMTFQFKCKAGSKCNATICPENELATVCLKNKFGEKASNDWLDWFNSVK